MLTPNVLPYDYFDVLKFVLHKYKLTVNHDTILDWFCFANHATVGTKSKHFGGVVC